MTKKILFTLVVVIAFLSGYLLNVWINHTEKKADSPPLIQNIVSSKPADKKPDRKEEKFSDEDLKTFKLIKSLYNDFEYSDKYTVTSEDEKKMVFNKEDNLYFGCYISYEVICSDEGIISYWFDAGTANRGYGSYYVIDEDTVIKIEKSVGTSACCYEIFKNGIKIDSGTKEYDCYENN